MVEKEREYYTLEEAADYIGIKRASIYNYMHDLNIESEKFGRTRRKYLSFANVKRIKEYKENPWKEPRASRKNMPEGIGDTNGEPLGRGLPEKLVA